MAGDYNMRMRIAGDIFAHGQLRGLAHLESLLDLQPVARELLTGRSDWPTLAELSDAARRIGVETASGKNLCFVPAPPRRRRRRRLDHADGDSGSLPSYERRIYELGEVQTRAASWHDLFNALSWMVFPKAKAVLNERQVLAADPLRVRTREQDRLAMLDEGGVVVVGDQVLLLGHALLEALVRGKGDIRAMALIVATRTETERETETASADAAAAAAIAGGALLNSEPMPVYDLGRGVMHVGRRARRESESRSL